MLLFLAKCSGDGSVNPKDNSNPESSSSEHFSIILYDGLNQNITGPVIKMLEDNYARVLGDLNLISMNRVTVKIWSEESNFLNDMQSDIGTRYPGSTGYVYGPAEVRILYRGNAAQTALHEFCHAASLVVNYRFGNNPRWLWEAVAIYESGEFRDPKSIGYLVSGNYPSIEELNSDFNAGNNKIYEVGYLISEYIISNWGKTSYVNLIKSNGNIAAAIGITVNQFEEEWRHYVQSRYF